MPTFSETTPRVAYKFAGIDFSVPAPYSEGHVLLPNEATFMNRMLAGTMGNQYAGDIRKEVAKLDAERAEAFKAKTYTGPTTTDAKGKTIPAPATVTDLTWDHQARFIEKFTNYTPGASTRGTGAGGSSDPVVQMARSLALAKVKELVAKKGLKIMDLYKSKNAEGVSKVDQLVTDYIAKNEWVLALAKSTVEATQGHDDDLDLPEPEAEAA